MYEATKAYPGRFYAFATLPLDDPKEAACELERTVKEMGFKGALIAGVYNGHRLDDAYYYPIYEKAIELNVPIYLHPAFPSNDIVEHYYKGDWPQRVTTLLSGFGIGWHYEIGMQIVRMIVSGIFNRYPELKICTGHWGEDYPKRMPENIRTMLEEFELSEEDCEKIAHGNAEKLLHLL